MRPIAADANAARIAQHFGGARVAELVDMSHELHCYDYVNQPYATVRREVLADPQALFRLATSGGKNSQLHVRIGALELGADIAIEVRSIEEKCAPLERPSTRLVLEWRSLRSAALFPLMKATLTIYPLTPTETQLELAGTYDPPFGALGDAIDAVALHRFAQSSVTSFVREISTHLRRALTTNQATA